MRTDTESGNYYLENVGGKQDWAKNVDSASSDKRTHGFFPFNETSTPCKASKYNYGFGTKLNLNSA